MIYIDIINASKTLQDSEIKSAVPAFQTQVNRDWMPAWGYGASLSFIPKGNKYNPQHWVIVVLDNSDQAGALGYHDVTTTGKPIGKVFAGTDKQYGYNWTITFTHELLEMLGDPYINLTAQADNGDFWAYEVGDPVEADSFGYQINGIWVSDFVYPEYFETIAGATKFDHQAVLTAPFSISKGGYMSVFTGGKWTQVPGQDRANDIGARAPVGSRRERRLVGKSNWIVSTNEGDKTE